MSDPEVNAYQESYHIKGKSYKGESVAEYICSLRSDRDYLRDALLGMMKAYRSMKTDGKLDSCLINARQAIDLSFAYLDFDENSMEEK